LVQRVLMSSRERRGLVWGLRAGEGRHPEAGHQRLAGLLPFLVRFVVGVELLCDPHREEHRDPKRAEHQRELPYELPVRSGSESQAPPPGARRPLCCADCQTNLSCRLKLGEVQRPWRWSPIRRQTRPPRLPVLMARHRCASIAANGQGRALDTSTTCGRLKKGTACFTGIDTTSWSIPSWQWTVND